jgi:peptidoglycan hydrolase-like protein with peptidoglycan-binding domain
MRRPLRRTAAIAALLVLAGCAQVRKVGRSDAADRPEDGREERQPETSAAPPRDKGQPAEHGRPPLPATPSSLVTAAAARQLKAELRTRGFLENPSPGPELDAATSDALRKFQQEEGLAATGFPDQETLRRLNIDASEAYRAAPDETNP